MYAKLELNTTEYLLNYSSLVVDLYKSGEKIDLLSIIYPEEKGRWVQEATFLHPIQRSKHWRELRFNCAWGAPFEVLAVRGFYAK